MKYKRVLAVGDVHGMHDKLAKLFIMIKFNPEEDLLVFLGDYIDRGLDSISCLDYLISLQKLFPHNVICLKGNHEEIAIKCLSNSNLSSDNLLDDIDSFGNIWLRNGGYNTMVAFANMSSKMRRYYLSWMKSLRLHYSYSKFYFCHAGVNPFHSFSEQTDNDLLWIRHSFFEEYKGNKIVVVGHTATISRTASLYIPKENDHTKPQFLQNNIIMCDTGAFRVGGKLSCVDVLSKTVWQV